MPRNSAVSPISPAEARARLQEARAYLDTAELLGGSDSAAERKVSGSNAILAGVAAADAICGLALGERNSGDDHAQAVELVKRAIHPATKAANSLKRLLAQKTPVQYGVQPVSSADSTQLVRWARDVVELAIERAR